MIKEIKKEINFLKILIWILWVILLIFWGTTFMFNQYINNIYKSQFQIEKKNASKLQLKINKKVSQISKLLEWKDLDKIKWMQSLYNLYFKTRYQTLPKDLVLEMLEEILPDNAKIWNSIKIWKDASVNLVLYTTNIKWLDILYNKFKYYSDILKLLSIKWFKTITLNKNNSDIRMIVKSNSKYVYKTTIQIQLNNQNIINYYALLYHPTKNYQIMKKLYWEWIIEPTKIPDNVTINDSIKLHNLYEKKYDIETKSTNK